MRATGLLLIVTASTTQRDNEMTKLISNLNQDKKDFISSELKVTGHTHNFTSEGVVISHKFYKKVGVRTIKTVLEFAEYLGMFVSEIQVFKNVSP